MRRGIGVASPAAMKRPQVIYLARQTESRFENRIGPPNELAACRGIEGRPLRFSPRRLRFDPPGFMTTACAMLDSRLSAFHAS